MCVHRPVSATPDSRAYFLLFSFLLVSEMCIVTTRRGFPQDFVEELERTAPERYAMTAALLEMISV